MTYTPNSSRLAKNVILLYARMMLMMLIGLYTSRVVLSTLGVEDYGIYNVVGGVVTMFGFLNAGLTSSTQRFLTFELGKGNPDRLNQIFVTSQHIHFLISIGIVLLAESVGIWFLTEKMVIPAERMQAAFWCLQLSIFTTVVSIMSYPYNAVIVAHERMSAFAYISLLDAVLKLLLVYLLLLSNADRLILYASLFALEKLLIRLIYNLYCKRHFAECRYRLIINVPLFKEMFSFAGWNMWSNLAWVCYSEGLNMLLNLFFGPVVNAARAIAIQVQGAIGQLAGNFHLAINPQITKAYAAGQTQDIHRLVYQSSRLTFCLLWICCMPVIMEAPTILHIWLGNPPAYAGTFIRIMLVTMMIECTANPLATSIAATGRIRKCEAIIGSILLSILPVSYCVLRLGAAPWAVFVVHLAIAIIAFIVRLFIVRPMINLNMKEYATMVLYRCAMVCVISLIFPLLTKVIFPAETIYSLLIVVVSLISALVSTYWLALNRAERATIHTKVISSIRKLCH